MNCSRNFFFFCFPAHQPVNFSRQLLFWGNIGIELATPGLQASDLHLYTILCELVSGRKTDSLLLCHLRLVRGPSSLAHMSVFSVSKNTQQRASTISGPERTKCGLGLFFASNQQQLEEMLVGLDRTAGNFIFLEFSTQRKTQQLSSEDQHGRLAGFHEQGENVSLFGPSLLETIAFPLDQRTAPGGKSTPCTSLDSSVGRALD